MVRYSQKPYRCSIVSQSADCSPSHAGSLHLAAPAQYVNTRQLRPDAVKSPLHHLQCAIVDRDACVRECNLVVAIADLDAICIHYNLQPILLDGNAAVAIGVVDGNRCYTGLEQLYIRSTRFRWDRAL